MYKLLCFKFFYTDIIDILISDIEECVQFFTQEEKTCKDSVKHPRRFFILTNRSCTMAG